jgi:hypothetical protein
MSMANTLEYMSLRSVLTQLVGHISALLLWVQHIRGLATAHAVEAEVETKCHSYTQVWRRSAIKGGIYYLEQGRSARP